MLELQGDNDPRVPKEEAQQVVDILKKEGLWWMFTTMRMRATDS